MKTSYSSSKIGRWTYPSPMKVRGMSQGSFIAIIPEIPKAPGSSDHRLQPSQGGGSGGIWGADPPETFRDRTVGKPPIELLTLEMVYYVYSWLYHMTRICGGPQGHSTQTPRSMSGHMVGAEAQAIPPAARNAYFRAQNPCRENRIEQVIWVCKIGDVRAISSDERPVDLGYTL